jgi:flagellin
LDGSLNDATFQVGANAGQTISFGVNSAKSSSLGQIAQGTGTEVTAAEAADITVQIGGGSVVNVSTSANFEEDATYKDKTSAFAKAEAINDAGITGLTVSTITQGSATAGVFGGTAGDTYNLSVNGVAVYTDTAVDGGLTVTEVRDAINSHTDETGVRASVSGGALSLTANDGQNIVVAESGTGFTAGTDGITVAAGDFAATLRGTLSLSSSENITLGGTIATIGFTGNITVDTNGIDDVDISSRAGAEVGIQRIDAAIASIDDTRAGLGAIQNRFDSTITNLNNVAENLSAARSRILDADFAQETASLTRNQILQQAGLSILAQANQSQQSVLALLG